MDGTGIQVMSLEGLLGGGRRRSEDAKAPPIAVAARVATLKEAFGRQCVAENMLPGEIVKLSDASGVADWSKGVPVILLDRRRRKAGDDYLILTMDPDGGLMETWTYGYCLEPFDGPLE